MVFTSICIDKMQARIDFGSAHSPEYRQCSELWWSVRDHLFDIPGTIVPSHPKSSLSAANQPLKHGGNLFVRYGWQQGKYRAWYEFNPSKAFIPELAAHFDLLLDYGGMSLLERATVTYFEIAIDVSGARYCDYAFFDTRLASGGTEHPGLSEYLGSWFGARFFICYDKRREMINHGLGDIGTDRLRIEARLQGRRGFPLREIESVANPFGTLMVLDKQLLLQSNESALDPLREAVKAGQLLQPVYRALPRHRRLGVEAAALECRPPWWDIVNIWKAYPSALSWRRELIDHLVQGSVSELDESSLEAMGLQSIAKSNWSLQLDFLAPKSILQRLSGGSVHRAKIACPANVFAAIGLPNPGQAMRGNSTQGPKKQKNISAIDCSVRWPRGFIGRKGKAPVGSSFTHPRVGKKEACVPRLQPLVAASIGELAV